MKTTVSGIAEELRRLREQAGLTRKELGEVGRTSEKTIQLIETGQSASPRPETLRLLAHGLAYNRLQGRVDREQAEAIYGQFLEAAGYSADVMEPPARQIEELDDDLRAMVLDLVNADEGVFRAILHDLATRSEQGKREALSFWAHALQFGRDRSRRRGRP